MEHIKDNKLLILAVFGNTILLSELLSVVAKNYGVGHIYSTTRDKTDGRPNGQSARPL